MAIPPQLIHASRVSDYSHHSPHIPPLPLLVLLHYQTAYSRHVFARPPPPQLRSEHLQDHDSRSLPVCISLSLEAEPPSQERTHVWLTWPTDPSNHSGRLCTCVHVHACACVCRCRRGGRQSHRAAAAAPLRDRGPARAVRPPAGLCEGAASGREAHLPSRPRPWGVPEARPRDVPATDRSPPIRLRLAAVVRSQRAKLQTRMPSSSQSRSSRTRGAPRPSHALSVWACATGTRARLPPAAYRGIVKPFLLLSS